MNILLNNGEAQGEFDIEKLGTLLRDPSLDLSGTGFDQGDVFKLFGDSSIIDRVGDSLDEFAAKVRAARDLYAKIAERAKAKDSDTFYMVVVFRNEEEMVLFLERAGLEDTRYQSGDDFFRLCGIERQSE